jgi:hypothetical protein
MGRRRKKEGVSISLVPILSIQKCAMGIMVVIICAQTTVSIAKTADQYLEVAGSTQDRDPIYVECQDKQILIHPEKTEVSLDLLKGKGPSPFHQLMDDLRTNPGKRYLVLLVRPDGIASYDRCFRMAKDDYKVDVGKDALLAGGNIILTKNGRPVLNKK